MAMQFFKDLQFQHYNYLPSCRAWIDQRFDRYALNFCRSGRILWAMHDGEPRFLSAPLAWWTVPGPRYVYGSAPGESWEHFYVTFYGKHSSEMHHSDLIPASQPEHFCYLSDATHFSDTFFRLFKILDAAGLHCPRAVLTLQDLLLQLHEQSPAVAQMSPVEIEVRAWLEEVRATPEKPWNVPEQARRLAVSEVHLRRMVNAIVGMPPHRFIVERRLEQCAARLRNSNEPIKVLAQACGFTDVPHFTRLFTRRYSTPPAAYRCEVQLLETDREDNSRRTLVASLPDNASSR